MKTIIVLPIPGIENFKPKKILRSSPSLEIPSTPPPPPGDLHGTSFQSSPKINRMLITTLICIR